MPDTFNARAILQTRHAEYIIYRLDALENAGLTQLGRLPFSIRILLEATLRQCNQKDITRQDVLNIAGWKPIDENRPGIAFLPARVVMQDFTGVPAVADLAAMRTAVARLGGDPRKVNPAIPVDLVVDHSIQVDFFATQDSFKRNTEVEFQRNRERYEFLKWGQQAFSNFRLVPPATGIVHQVNLEFLSQVVMTRQEQGDTLAFPDTLIGTDSHTTMVNGLGVLGWGVGGIEAEAAMLGQPMDMLLPDVVGFKLYGRLPEGVTATDLVLTITQVLRQKGVVGKFVEFYGPGLDSLSLPDRATVANMAPEYGATVGFFPADIETLRYMRLTGRSEEIIDRAEAYLSTQGLFRNADTPDPEFSDLFSLDLASVVSSMAGPKRPQDRRSLKEMKASFHKALTAPLDNMGYGLTAEQSNVMVTIGTNGGSIQIGHGAVVIAAITSCTNTSNPSVMIAAGLVAKKAVEKGLTIKPYVKTSLAPGSRVVTEYLEQAKLLEPLAKLGFNLVGYGCTTCIGNSGPLPGEVAKGITTGNLVTAAVLSGNRNFEGRIHPLVKANYLASPPLVVAYALAGTVNIDLQTEPLATGKDGKPVYLRELWPSTQEVIDTITSSVIPEMFINKYSDVFADNELWNAIPVDEGDQYPWDIRSTYIQRPPFFQELSLKPPNPQPIHSARVLVMLADSITTDHISPAGSIPVDSPAGKFLIEQGVAVRDFNSYGSRRGNDQVMTRGTFANIRLRNLLLPGEEGGNTLCFAAAAEGLAAGEKMAIFDAAQEYRRAGVPLIVLAGKEYGSGSSRDWAAKGTLLLGVRAVIAESFERIHRSNLVGMGVLPLQFQPGQNVTALGLKGDETYDIHGLAAKWAPKSIVAVKAKRDDGTQVIFKVHVLLNTPTEWDYYRNGGILHTVLRNLLQS